MMSQWWVSRSSMAVVILASPNTWGEKCRPGYGLYDRALGAVYLNGLWEAVSKFAPARG